MTKEEKVKGLFEMYARGLITIEGLEYEIMKIVKNKK